VLKQKKMVRSAHQHEFFFSSLRLDLFFSAVVLHLDNKDDDRANGGDDVCQYQRPV
jgi:hypothetical protein